MGHPLEQLVQEIARRARRRLLCIGAAYAFCGALVLALGLGSLDYLFRYADPGLRWLSSLALFAGCAAAFARWVWPAWRLHWRDVTVARRIEQRFPQYADLFSSALEFQRLSVSAAGAGSPALRTRTVLEAAAAAEQIQPADVVDSRPARKAFALAAVGLAVVVGLVFIQPSLCGIALTRLVWPTSEATWPTRNRLVLVDPTGLLALGETLAVSVSAAPDSELPAEATLQVRWTDAGGHKKLHSLPMSFAGGQFHAAFDDVQRPLEYRAVGGDDEAMLWQQLQVVEPPLIETITATIAPPEYAHWPNEESGPSVRALAGSRITWHVRSTKPLAHAELHLPSGATLTSTLAEAGYGAEFVAPAADQPSLTQGGEYWVSLTDSDGLTAGDAVKYSLQVLPDHPPGVVLEEPSGSRFVTPTARVRLRAQVREDLAIERVVLRFSSSAKSEQAEEEIILYVASDRTMRPRLREQSGESRIVEHVWELAPLNLAPGVQLSYYVVAADYLPQWGQSSSGRLTVVSSEQLHEQLLDRQVLIHGELSRLAELQQQARDKVASVEALSAGAEAFTAADLDQLRSAQSLQQQIARGLVSRDEGVRLLVDSVLADLNDNQLDDVDLQRRMQSLRERLTALESGASPQASESLEDGIKTVEPLLNSQDSDRRAEAAHDLAEAESAQSEILSELEAMLGELGRLDGFQRTARDLRRVMQQQQDLADDTRELAPRTLAQDLSDLSPEDRAALERLAQQQQQLARAFEQAQQDLSDAQSELAGADQGAADTAGDALRHAAQTALAGAMRDASRALGENQLGQAQAQQQAASDALREMLDILAERGERELAGLVEKLRAAAGQLAELRAEQAGLRDKFAAAGEIPDEAQRREELRRLQAAQAKLEEEAAALSRTLRRLQAAAAANRLAQGSRQMQGASNSGGDAAAAAQAAQAAQDDLDSAQEALADAQRRAERDLAAEQLSQLADRVRGLADRQRRVLGEIERVRVLRQAEGRLSRSEAQGLLQWAQEEQLLANQTSEQAKLLTGAPVFHLALQDAAGSLSQAAAGLTALQTDPPVIRAAASALRRLEQVLAVLESQSPPAEQPAEQQGQDNQQGGDQGQGGESSGGEQASLDELRLLRAIQADLNQQTAELRAEELDPEQGEVDPQEFARLSAMQGQLADMLLNLLQPPATQELDDPEGIDLQMPDSGEPAGLPMDGEPIEVEEIE